MKKKKSIWFMLFNVMMLTLLLLSGCKTNQKEAISNLKTEKIEKTTDKPTEELSNESNENTSEESMNDPTEEPREIELYIFIAASLSNVMEEIQIKYKEIAPNVNIKFNADSSGTLQTQIEEGATCDIFFSAAQKQMTALDDEGYIYSDSITKLLENKVVLIKPTGGETKVTGFENIYEADNIALAGEDVPVGAYALEILTNLGILDQVKAMEINQGANVTAVLAAVSEKSNEIGVVYATDASSVADSVEVIAEAPQGSLQTPVIYPIALVKNPEAGEKEYAAAKEFLTYLTTEEVYAIFEKYGFTIYANE